MSVAEWVGLISGLGTLALTVFLLVKGAGLWQGKREAADTYLLEKIAVLTKDKEAMWAAIGERVDRRHLAEIETTLRREWLAFDGRLTDNHDKWRRSHADLSTFCERLEIKTEVMTERLNTLTERTNQAATRSSEQASRITVRMEELRDRLLRLEAQDRRQGT